MRFIRRSGLPTDSKVELGVWEILIKLGSEADARGAADDRLKGDDFT